MNDNEKQVSVSWRKLARIQWAGVVVIGGLGLALAKWDRGNIGETLSELGRITARHEVQIANLPSKADFNRLDDKLTRLLESQNARDRGGYRP